MWRPQQWCGAASSFRPEIRRFSVDLNGGMEETDLGPRFSQDSREIRIGERGEGSGEGPREVVVKRGLRTRRIGVRIKQLDEDLSG